jgi:hypothetical protein
VEKEIQSNEWVINVENQEALGVNQLDGPANFEIQV